MTIRPVPARAPWLSSRDRLVRVPGLSAPYQLRISFARSLMPFSPVGSATLAQKRLGQRHVVWTANHDGDPLVRRGGLDLLDPFVTGAGLASRLLDQERHGRRLVL